MQLWATPLGEQWLAQNAQSPERAQSRLIEARIAALPGLAMKLNRMDAALNAVETPRRTEKWLDARDAVDRAKAKLDACNAIISEGVSVAQRRAFVLGEAELQGWAKSFLYVAGTAAAIIALVLFLPELALAAGFSLAVTQLITLMGVAAVATSAAVGGIVAGTEDLVGALGLGGIAGGGLLLAAAGVAAFLLFSRRRAS